jgi:hypothetical protein
LPKLARCLVETQRRKLLQRFQVEVLFHILSIASMSVPKVLLAAGC